MIVLLATLKGWNRRQTHRNLTGRNTTWRNMLGIQLSEIPPRRTLNDRWSHPLVRHWQQRITKRMFMKLLNQRNLYLVSIDMSDLPSEFYDGLANWGFCGKGYFYGYKLHLVVTRDGVPLSCVTTRANCRETSVTDRLLTKAAEFLSNKQISKLSFVIGDKAYDSNKAADEAKQRLLAQMIVPANPRRSQELKGKLTIQTKKKLKKRGTNRDKAILLYEGKRGRQLFRTYRVTIEQVIDQLKNDLGLERLPYWVRGVRKVQRRVQNADMSILLCKFPFRRTTNIYQLSLRSELIALTESYPSVES